MKKKGAYDPAFTGKIEQLSECRLQKRREQDFDMSEIDFDNALIPDLRKNQFIDLFALVNRLAVFANQFIQLDTNTVSY